MFSIFDKSAQKTSNSRIVLNLVKEEKEIDQQAASKILVESFIGEYEKYLKPNEIGERLTSWRDGESSVQDYYEKYFDTEFEDYTKGVLDFWVQATISGKLVGWATFQREKSDPNAVYMNLLVVHPEYQGKGIGGALVQSLTTLQQIPELTAIHVLLRKKNLGGRVFYSKLGFNADPTYQREDNFVDVNLLESITWKNPVPQNKLAMSKATV